MIGFFQSIRRAPYQFVAAFMVLFFTLFLITSLIITLSFIYGLLGYVETRPQVTVYFQTKALENDIFKIRDELVKTDKTTSVKYISKQQAFTIYKEANKDTPLLLETISADILPASLEIYAKTPQMLPEIANFLKDKQGVDEVYFQKDIVDRLINLTSILRYASLILFTFLIIMSIVVMTTTTMFKVALKKDEIELLQLLGATKFYIKKPYLKEGMGYGLIASGAVFIVVGFILVYAFPSLQTYFRGIPSLDLTFAPFPLRVWPMNVKFILIVFSIVTLFGMVIGLIASSLAVDKYLSK
ncbi:MAG: permease-like cell division protein FtsX [Candidatus Roizmanbacteria bacterium]